MPKNTKVVHVTKTVRKNADGSAAAVTSSIQTAQPAATLTQAEADRLENEKEISEHAEFDAMKRKEMFQRQHHDPMSQYLQARFKVKVLFPTMEFKDSRFPVDTYGEHLTVTRYYPTLGLIFDRLPKDYTVEMALAKKWVIEHLPLDPNTPSRGNYRYIWSIEGEKFTDEEGIMKPGQMPEALIWDREKPLKKKPDYEFIYNRPMQQFAFGGRVTVSR